MPQSFRRSSWAEYVHNVIMGGDRTQGSWQQSLRFFGGLRSRLQVSRSTSTARQSRQRGSALCGEAVTVRLLPQHLAVAVLDDPGVLRLLVASLSTGSTSYVL